MRTPFGFSLPILLLGALFWGAGLGCATLPAGPATPPVTVEGRVYVAGNEPFTELLLTTPDRHAYVLRFDEATRTEVQNQVPAVLTVTGTVYPDQWGGSTHAFIRVQSWQKP